MAAPKAEAERMLRSVSPKTYHACMQDARVDAIHMNDDALALVNARALL